MRHENKFQRMFVPLVSLIMDLKPLFPGPAIGVIKRKDVIKIEHLKTIQKMQEKERLTSRKLKIKYFSSNEEH